MLFFLHKKKFVEAIYVLMGGNEDAAKKTL